VDTDTYVVRGRGDLQTLRLDDATGTVIDIAASQGVLGFRHINGSLYIALDAAVEPAVVVTATRTHDAATYLKESAWHVSHLERIPCRLRFAASGYGSGPVVWATTPGSLWRVEATGFPSATARADAHGTLAVTLPASGGATRDVTLSCVEDDTK
jgi:hypothetical protein